MSGFWVYRFQNLLWNPFKNLVSHEQLSGPCWYQGSFKWEVRDSSYYLNYLIFELLENSWLNTIWSQQLATAHFVNVFLHPLYLQFNLRHVFPITALKGASQYGSSPKLIHPVHKCKNPFSFSFMALSSPDVPSASSTICLPYRAVKTLAGFLICSEKDWLLFFVSFASWPWTSFFWLLITLLYLTHQRLQSFLFLIWIQLLLVDRSLLHLVMSLTMRFTHKAFLLEITFFWCICSASRTAALNSLHATSEDLTLLGVPFRHLLMKGLSCFILLCFF